MEDCLFCSIIAGKIPAAKVFESEHLFAFLDINPANKGHTLLVPREHCQDILTVDPALGRDFLEGIQRIIPAVLSVTGATGFNVIQNNGKSAGQEIFHLHWHLIPRFDGDGLRLWQQRKYDSQEEMLRLATAVKVQIGL